MLTLDRKQVFDIVTQLSTEDRREIARLLNMDFPERNHLVLSEDGKVRIAGSRIKVSHIASLYRSGLQTTADFQEAFPHLTPAQIHAALTYYFDNQTEIDAQLAVELERVETLRQQQPNPMSRAHLEGIRQARRQQNFSHSSS